MMFWTRPSGEHIIAHLFLVASYALIYSITELHTIYYIAAIRFRITLQKDGNCIILTQKTNTMADFKKMLPLIFHFAAGVYGRNGADLLLPPEQQFEIARISGWSHDPDDPGGPTMIDVTLATYSAYRKQHGIAHTGTEHLRAISFEEWSEILKTMFWDKWKGDEIDSQGIANLLADWVWGSGEKTIRNAQRVIGVKADGIVGPKTLTAINSADPAILFAHLRDARESYFRNCRGAWKYLRGWLRRLAAIRPDGSICILQFHR